MAAKNYIIHMLKSEKPVKYGHHRLWYASSLKSVSSSAQMLYSYEHVIDGFSASLTNEEAQLMAAQEGVLAVEPDTIHKLHTTWTPTFLGLDRLEHHYKYMRPISQEQSIVIGVVDTGIWPESLSFRDTGYGPIPSFWRGKCEFNESLCNKKLIGARYFAKGYEQGADIPLDWNKELRSPRDTDGHGTHISSTAAGSIVHGASLFGYAYGTARGMAPRARIAMYKACWNGNCFGSDLFMAIDTAISDGVHVLSMSLGPPADYPFYRSVPMIGAFAAAANGIFVSCSVGNDGPDSSSVRNAAPWVTSVGAGTIDRAFLAYVKLGNGETYNGSSLNSGPPWPLAASAYAYTPFVYAGQVSENGSGFCLNGTLFPMKVKGKIVLCDRGINSRLEKGEVVRKAGGVGMVLANTNGEDLIPDIHFVPAAHVGRKAGDNMRNYLSFNPNPTAKIMFGGTRISFESSPNVASFSSRGPTPISPELLKPDLIAPGYNIIAAWSRANGPTWLSFDTRQVDFNIASGTSMSCPHVSGVAALLKAVHPEWSPAAIRSALMTTAYTTNMRGSPMIDESTGNASTPFQHGAGHVNPLSALVPGLVYNLTTEDYLNFLCAIKYTPEQIMIVTRQNFTCDFNKTYSATELNYPSFAVQVSADINTTTVVTHKRTVTNVESYRSTYKVSVFSQSSSVKIDVAPRMLTFWKQYQTRSYTVTFQMTGPMQPNTHEFGEIKWCDGKHVVRTPIAISWI
ncbi:Subtilisin-like protease SBT1.7 [Striga hermonthica]|uniref:Subtilisin-like protease SBT1.7 n=1 Tax=Striga hermonthica TaxID=68872 RepID=A0A9N7R6N5_STRHE|nr:Subtilisin-like protease SBT1.7 [Striga hermonthica]